MEYQFTTYQGTVQSLYTHYKMPIGEAAVAQWSELWSRNPEVAGMTPGCIKKGIWCKAIAKSFLQVLVAVVTPA